MKGVGKGIKEFKDASAKEEDPNKKDPDNPDQLN